MHWIDGMAAVARTAHEPGSVALIGPRPPGRSEPVRSGPQAFMALLPGGGYELQTHYHRVDQFQLIVDGAATMANHHVRFGHLHFSDRMQPYGPIRPEADGLAFLTLRAQTGGGVFYMPDSRSLLADGLATLPEPVATRRNLTFDLLAAPAGSLLDDHDGLHIELLTCHGGAETPAHQVGGAGAYLVVIAGTVVVHETDERRELGPGALCWVDAGNTLDRLTAGPSGLTVAVLQYPSKAALPGADEAPMLATAAR